MEKMTAFLQGADIAPARQMPTSRRTSARANNAPIFHQNRVSNHAKQAKQWKNQMLPQGRESQAGDRFSGARN
jgi:hypothetical protein